MENLDWDEVVDSYVDGELSDEERRRVEARAETDLELRERIEWASELHGRFASLRTTVPEGFAERLLDAINSSSVWDEIASGVDQPLAAETLRRAERKVPRRRLMPVAVAACAVVAVAGLAIAGFNSLRSSGPAPEGVPVANNGNPNEGLVPSDAGAPETRPLIMTPSPAGNAPESVVAERSPNGLWSSVSFADGELKKRVREFQSLCGKCDGLKIKKVKSDFEFELTNVKPANWRDVAEWIENTADSYEFSDALRAWSAKENGQTKPRILRVSFRSSVEENATEAEQTER